MTDRRVLFYVQHLLGIGHLRRAATITRALQRAGLETTLVSGGNKIEGIDLHGADFVQLDPIRALDESFKTLVDSEGRVVDDAWKRRRSDSLLKSWERVRPHILMFELFPFGRRQMRFELLPLLDAARAAKTRPLVVSSVRDILVGQQKPERQTEMRDLIAKYFDRVLVHGDSALIPFDRTFPLAKEIADKITYTGYVVDESAAKENLSAQDGVDEILVSAGGGAVGEKLLACAMAARPLSRFKASRWRILVGAAADDTVFSRLKAQAGNGVAVERARPDFPQMLRRARASISQAGYNTLMEIIQASCPALVVPFAGGTETEQTLRADLLCKKNIVSRVREEDMTPRALAEALDALPERRTLSAGIDTNGAVRTGEIVARWAQSVNWQ